MGPSYRQGAPAVLGIRRLHRHPRRGRRAAPPVGLEAKDDEDSDDDELGDAEGRLGLRGREGLTRDSTPQVR